MQKHTTINTRCFYTSTIQEVSEAGDFFLIERIYAIMHARRVDIGKKRGLWYHKQRSLHANRCGSIRTAKERIFL